MYMTFMTFNMYIFACRVQKITVEGCTYREGDIVVVGKEDDTPILGQIGTIYYYFREDKCFFTITLMHAEFNSHYHSYSIVTSSHTYITTPQRLYTPHPVNTHKCFDTQLNEHMFVCFKFNVLYVYCNIIL